MILTALYILLFGGAGLACLAALVGAAHGERDRRRDYRTDATWRALGRAERRRETATPEFERRHGLARRGSTP